jgi:23S rRNA pseudouridine2605 synthase
MMERLQKFLAGAGIASRRKAEELVLAGRVSVNGVVVKEMGTKVDPAIDHVVVDGRIVETGARHRYILLYKPPGCVTTLSDPEGRPTVARYLTGVTQRVFPVGRLDWDAEGALLFTTDGDLANRLAHPRYGHQRTYLVKVKGDPPTGALGRLLEGVRLEDGPAKALEATLHEKVEKNTWIRIVVGEGRRHLVKRLCESVGLEVLRLFRPEFGGVTVARLRPGRYRDLTAEEVDTMRRAAGLLKGPRPEPSFLPLPKAGRRHGHGPPEPGGGRSPRPAVEPGVEPGADRDARRPDREARRPDRDTRRPDREARRPDREPRGRPESRPGKPRSATSRGPGGRAGPKGRGRGR